MPMWKLYLRWMDEKGFKPVKQYDNKFQETKDHFNSKEDADRYFKAHYKKFYDEGWIAEMMIKKVGE